MTTQDLDSPLKYRRHMEKQRIMDRVADILQRNTVQLVKEMQEMNPDLKMSEFTRLGFCSAVLNEWKQLVDRIEFNNL